MRSIDPNCLEIERVALAFGGLKALDDVSLSFRPGRVTSLIGPNGAGKTTLFNVIMGFLHPHGGRVLHGGRDITTLEPHQIGRLGIGRLFQDVRVFRQMTTLENVLLATPHQPGENLFAGFFRPQQVARCERGNRARAMEYLERVGLADAHQVWAEQLSFGQQKLLAIARLLAQDCQVLLLDEPTAGVAPALSEQIAGRLRQIAAEGRTIVAIEHDLSLVMRLSDWVYLMDRGGVVAFGTPAEVLCDEALRAAYLGDAEAVTSR